MDTIYRFLSDKVFDTVDYLKYDVLRLNQEESKLPREIPFQFHKSNDSKLVWIDSAKYPGLFASGENSIELWHCLNDAVLSYFEVPRYEAKKRGYPYSLPLPNGEVIVQKDAQEYAGA